MKIEIYILFSISLNQFYIGYTKDLKKRILMHRNGVLKGSHTSKVKDWEVYFHQECESIAQARRIEEHIKRMKSRRYIDNLHRYPEIIERLLEKYR